MNTTTVPPCDALESCLRAVLAYLERPISVAALRARVAGGRELWNEDTLVEAADSLGCEVRAQRIDRAAPALPALPAICMTKEGAALAGGDHPSVQCRIEITRRWPCWPSRAIQKR